MSLILIRVLILLPSSYIAVISTRLELQTLNCGFVSRLVVDLFFLVYSAGSDRLP